ncbi:glycosyltransferase family 4 protein [Spirosoma validum]|uniref:Glycosyltransferase family 4 protein n=1 Tax=Spirosoma validum TaxID=2771355 RepID=A0A927AWZ9_9BACT|nr:glycosyltransferase family 4 protein [Spirosoma validum]MBD2751371.1 glycosyltransferase family 4 protein [Spirosoma validum]
MNILYLTFYFEPDLSPGSFRNTALVNELCQQLPEGSHVHVITTQPNRYQSYRPWAQEREEKLQDNCRITIDRVALPAHSGRKFAQIRAFFTYIRATYERSEGKAYDLVFASSSKLFTASLGATLAHSMRAPLFLDIRDLFRKGLLDLHKNPFIQLALNPIVRFVESFTFRSATHINLVSEGFQFYFKAYPQATYSYFTNGVDDIFLTSEQTPPSQKMKEQSEVKIILYAGNIGDGQALHKIIPQAAQRLGDRYHFVVIGEGNARSKLEKAIRDNTIRNVDLRKPVGRQELIVEYQKADYLFVHLSKLGVCKHVLPSKLFDYGATNKPILAGVTGFAASFVRENLRNSILFTPGDVESLASQLHKVPYRTEERVDFITRFQRKTISRAMARQIRQTLEAARR